MNYSHSLGLVWNSWTKNNTAKRAKRVTGETWRLRSHPMRTSNQEFFCKSSGQSHKCISSHCQQLNRRITTIRRHWYQMANQTCSTTRMALLYSRESPHLAWKNWSRRPNSPTITTLTLVRAIQSLNSSNSKLRFKRVKLRISPCEDSIRYPGWLHNCKATCLQNQCRPPKQCMHMNSQE